VDRHRLECFIALAEELNFHRAADRCHITQPAMSQQLRLLENQLQVQLIDRDKRRASLTPAGQVFLDEARRLIRQMELSVSLAQRTHRGEIGQLRVGVTSPALYVLFPEIIKAFRDVLPDIGVLISEMTTAQVEKALRDGDVQVGVVHPPLDDPSLACDLIAQVPFSVVLPDTHPLAERDTLELADLASAGFIMFPRQIAPKLYDSIIGLCTDAGFSPEIVMEAHPAQSIIALAAAGVGIGFIASRVQRLQRPGVVYRPLRGPRPYLSLGTAYLQDSRSEAMRVFLTQAEQVGAQLVN